MGCTAIFYSLCSSTLKCFEFLVDKVKLNHKNMNKETILFCAVEKGAEKAVEILLLKKVDIN